MHRLWGQVCRLHRQAGEARIHPAGRSGIGAPPPGQSCPSPYFLQVLEQAEELSPCGGAWPGPSAPLRRCEGELQAGRAHPYICVQAP